MNDKYKLKGNESFCIREGWLNKGITAIQSEPSVFSQNNAMDILGIGSKMVKSLKYWLLAADIAEEKKVRGSKNILRLTECPGEIINAHDRYFEDIFTLWILHYHIVRKISSCTVWNLFFNRFDASEFSKANMVNKIFDEFNKIYNKGSSVYKSVADDCGLLLKMYSASAEDDAADPEDNLSSPFADLGLIKRDSRDKGSFAKTRPVYDKLDMMAVLYVIVSNMHGEKKSADIDTLLMQDNNAGRVFNLDRTMLNEYLDRLKQSGYITLNRTAGLDMVYLKKDMLPADILTEYYLMNERDV